MTIINEDDIRDVVARSSTKVSSTSSSSSTSVRKKRSGSSRPSKRSGRRHSVLGGGGDSTANKSPPVTSISPKEEENDDDKTDTTVSLDNSSNCSDDENNADSIDKRNKMKKKKKKTKSTDTSIKSSSTGETTKMKKKSKSKDGEEKRKSKNKEKSANSSSSNSKRDEKKIEEKERDVRTRSRSRKRSKSTLRERIRGILTNSDDEDDITPSNARSRSSSIKRKSRSSSIRRVLRGSRRCPSAVDSLLDNDNNNSSSCNNENNNEDTAKNSPSRCKSNIETADDSKKLKSVKRKPRKAKSISPKPTTRKAPVHISSDNGTLDSLFSMNNNINEFAAKNHPSQRESDNITIDDNKRSKATKERVSRVKSISPKPRTRRKSVDIVSLSPNTGRVSLLSQSMPPVKQRLQQNNEDQQKTTASCNRAERLLNELNSFTDSNKNLFNDKNEGEGSALSLEESFEDLWDDNDLESLEDAPVKQQQQQQQQNIIRHDETIPSALHVKVDNDDGQREKCREPDIDDTMKDQIRQGEEKESFGAIKESLTKENQVLTKQLRDAESTFKDYREQVGKENQALNEQIREAKSNMKDLREQVASLQLLLEKRDCEVQSMRTKLIDTNHQNKILKEELDELLVVQATLSTASESNSNCNVALDNNEGIEERNDDDDDNNVDDGKLTSPNNTKLDNNNIKAFYEAKAKIESLERELEDATNVNKLQLEELDEEVELLQNKLKTEREDTVVKLKEKDSVIDALRVKLLSYEAAHRGTIDEDGNIESDVKCLASAKQKVYEARSDATSVRERLKEMTDRCDELGALNEELALRNASLSEQRRNVEELKSQLVDWTEKTYEWKSRAETAERKLMEVSFPSSLSEKVTVVPANPQGSFLQAAMDKNNCNGNRKGTANKRRGWLFRGNNNNNRGDTDDSSSSTSSGADELESLEIRNGLLNEEINKLKSNIVKLTSKHKEEFYVANKKMARLEGENEALTLKNVTLEKLSRFHHEE